MRLLRLASALLLSPLAFADSPPPLDGIHHVMRDELLDQLAGRWALTGVVAGREAKMEVTASWVLNHQFLQLQDARSAALAERPAAL